ncbi:MAG: methyltransferase [Saprospiraceae bacterium]|nr:methyltransferase [Saprospiraceae bacterium]
MRWMYRRFWLPLYRLWALRFIRRERVFRHGRLQLRVPPGVFHPGIFFSTPIFLDFLQNIDFQNKKTLDVGTGSGALALFAAQKGAVVTALDINPLAVQTTRNNAQALGLSVTLWRSDLLESLPMQQFDVVLINPPSYPKKPENAAEHAFFAGENLSYFEKLFCQLPPFLGPESKGWMILSEDCDLRTIQEIAGRYGFWFFNVLEQKKWGERFGIWAFGLRPSP